MSDSSQLNTVGEETQSSVRSRIALFIPLLLLLGLAPFLIKGLYLDPRAMPSALIDKPLPDFTLEVLGEARQVSRADIVGKVMLLNVWATWCISCRVEHPYLLQLSDEGVPIIGVNYKDEDSAAMQWLGDLGDPYSLNVVDAEGTLGLDLGVYGAPETYFVDASGIIRYRHVGVIDERVWATRLLPIYEELLSEGVQP